MTAEWLQAAQAAGRDPAKTIERWKRSSGGKAIGLVLADVPEELVHAAGALPVTPLLSAQTFEHADQRLQGFACSYSRSLLELADSGRLSWLDGLIVPYACDTTRCLDLIFRHLDRFEFHDCLRLPKRNSAEGVEDYFRDELQRVAQNLSAFTGREVGDESLRDGIRAYNRVRAPLERLRELMRRAALGIKASDYLSLVKAALVMAPEESAPLLEAAAAAAVAEPVADRPRLVVAGKLAQPAGVLDLIEAAGLAVIEDHLAVGGRWAAASVEENGDPIAALVKRQLNRLPFAGIWDGRPSRAAYLLERTKALKADGVALLLQKFCEPAEVDLPGIRQEIEREGIPLLVVETDFQGESLAAVETRVQAFAEMLKDKKRS